VAARRGAYQDGGVPPPEGFEYTVRADGSVLITHHGRPATTLRAGRAAAFLAEADGADDQQVMARWTGNYRRGNERQARQHPRNRPR
jgi:hypothetical protein